LLLITLGGRLFAAGHGWVSSFFVAPLPMLDSGNHALVKVPPTRGILMEQRFSIR